MLLAQPFEESTWKTRLKTHCGKSFKNCRFFCAVQINDLHNLGTALENDEKWMVYKCSENGSKNNLFGLEEENSTSFLLYTDLKEKSYSHSWFIFDLIIIF